MKCPCCGEELRRVRVQVKADAILDLDDDNTAILTYGHISNVEVRSAPKIRCFKCNAQLCVSYEVEHGVLHIVGTLP